MKLKVAIIVILVLAVFPTLVTGLAEQAVHGLLQALTALIGSPHG
jgi:hypothetical protein